MLHEKLTESDVKKIQEEIEHRKLVIRKEALESVKEARAHGDLSENFEYSIVLDVILRLILLFLKILGTSF